MNIRAKLFQNSQKIEKEDTIYDREMTGQPTDRADR